MGVDQGTTGTTVLLLDEDWNLAASSHKEHKQYYPQAGLGGTRSERNPGADKRGGRRGDGKSPCDS